MNSRDALINHLAETIGSTKEEIEELKKDNAKLKEKVDILEETLTNHNKVIGRLIDNYNSLTTFILNKFKTKPTATSVFNLFKRKR